jgi:hypothetical protein
MMKVKYLFLIGTCILLITTSVSSSEIFTSTSRKQICPPDDFIIENITQKDGAYHKAKTLSIEWWYFDAILNNNYSMHIGLMLLSEKNHGIVMPAINMYESGQNTFNLRKIYPLTFFKGSEEKPLIYFQDIPYIDGFIDNTTGIANYTISLSIGDASVELEFKSLMRGWKTDNWAIIMPKADVKGNITMKGEKLFVTGEGYHEHKWNMPLTFGLQNQGYYWGRISSNTTNLVWDEISTNRNGKKILAVMNYGVNNYTKINPEDFQFEIVEYGTVGLGEIPTKFKITIQSNWVTLNATMTARGIHSLNCVLMRYVRYNVKVSGAVNINQSIIENLHSESMMDHTEFR